MRVRRRTPALALPVALILGLGSCSSGDEPGPGTDATTSTAPTGSASETTEIPESEPSETAPTPPPRPAAMHDTGKKGAQAAAEHFIALVGYALQGGDTAPLQEIRFAGMCSSCQNFIDTADQYSADGAFVEGGAISLSDFTVSDRDSLTGGHAVSAAFSMEEMIVTASDGDEVESFEPDTGYLQIDVVHDGDDWRVMAMTSDQGAAQ
ncbi:hypothetical protein SAMN04489860_2568 [Paraoerskovia marina]|uniref:DUF6318 domain-containing protein n=1 Tax=Paraoerskovia marina TaxID=545619 RepID=A0A1H1VNY0_9CELL|nr:DUF6318 family protein [Paraoerskovia marina]SDS86628.1 hypothetical protein SAMN04489860_2568 [Paraoerskovia marina]